MEHLFMCLFAICISSLMKWKRLVEDTIKVINRLDSTSSLCLINALEFKALWPPFDKESTLIRPFITDKGDTLQIPIMEEGERYASFVDREGFQAVSMPYYGSCYRMLVVLPKTEKLALFSQSMTHELFINILDSLHEPEEVDVALPRFKSESDLSMTDLLKELLPSIFCDKSFGFNAMNDDLLNPPAIAAINQKTCIEVSEEGNKAQSVTEESWVEFLLKPEVIADHPFLYFIYDEATRAILLMGQFCGDGALSRDGDITLEEYFRNMKNEMN